MRGHCIALRRAESHRYARLIIAALLYNIAARRFLFLCVQVRTLPYKPPHENDMSRGALEGDPDELHFGARVERKCRTYCEVLATFYALHFRQIEHCR